jgi:hypothetical protein
MNLYNLHNNPESLDHYDVSSELVPDLFWQKYWYSLNELKKREQYIATSARYSYLYAEKILKGPFKLGETAISENAQTSYLYAKHVLKGPFKAGEHAISENAHTSNRYAKVILEGPFKAG